MRDKWVVKAIFVDTTGNPKGFSYYDRNVFDTAEECLAYIQDAEDIVQACSIDSEIEEDLKGLTFDDLVPIQIKDLPYAYVAR